MTTPTIYRRTTVDGEATLDGLLDAVAKISQVAPPSAQIVQVAEFFACPEEAHAAEEMGLEVPEHEPTAYLAFTVEWAEEEEA